MQQSTFNPDTKGNCSDKTNLIINYLPQCLTDAEFYHLFSSIGPVASARVIRDKTTGYSFGYGFVDYEASDDAAKAIDQLNKYPWYNKTIKVDYSKPSGNQTKNINLYVSGLPQSATEDDIKEKFGALGNIVQLRLVKDKNTGFSQGFAFVLYSSRDEANNAIQNLNGTSFDGSVDGAAMAVKFARNEQKPPPAAFLNHRHSVQPGFLPPPPQKNFWMPDMNHGGGGPMRGHNFRGSNRRYSPMRSSASYNNGTAGGGDYQRFDQQQPTNGSVVFVYGIGPFTNEDALFQLFSSCGNIVKVNVAFDQTKGAGKGYGFVTFSNEAEAQGAIASMNNYLYQGRPLQVSAKT